MSPQQQLVVDTIIDQNGNWINAKQIAEKTGIKNYNVFKILNAVQHPRIQKDKVKMNGIRTAYIAWRYSEEDNACGMALRLAKRHPGLWGQLEWSSSL